MTRKISLVSMKLLSEELNSELSRRYRAGRHRFTYKEINRDAKVVCI